jgi:hypothetical protein
MAPPQIGSSGHYSHARLIARDAFARPSGSPRQNDARAVVLVSAEQNLMIAYRCCDWT